VSPSTRYVHQTVRSGASLSSDGHVFFWKLNISRLLFTCTRQNEQWTGPDVTHFILAGLRCPDAKGHMEDIVLGFDTVDGYNGVLNPFFWGTTGR
jgi:hypothetical protein